MPTSSVLVIMLSSIADSISVFFAVGGRFRVVLRAYSLKKYLCVPLGGHGPP